MHQGVFNYKNGNVYRGLFNEQGQRDGEGMLYYKAGAEKYVKGTFKENKPWKAIMFKNG